MAEPAYKLPEEDQPDIRPDLGVIQGGGQGNGVPRGDLREAEAGAAKAPGASDSGETSTETGESSESKSLFNAGGDKADYGSDEDSSDESPASSLAGAEDAAGGLYNSEDNSGSKRRFRIKSKRRAAAGGGLFGVILGVIVFSSIASGPLQVVHFAQLLQQWHMRSNEDFSDSRASKFLYTIAGQNQDTRLGALGNKAADAWEAKMVEETGMRPAYDAVTRRTVGLVIVDKDKAFSTLLDASDRNDKTSKNISRIAGDGAEIVTASEASAGKQDIVIRGGAKVDGSTHILKIHDSGQARVLIKSMGAVMNTNRIVGAEGARLLIKRGAVDFAPLKDVRRKAGQKLADYWTERRRATAEEEAKGATTAEAKKDTATNKDGTPVESATDSAATDSANGVIADASKSFGRDAIKKIVAKAGKGGAVIGVLCAAKSIGNDIPKFKYINDVLPMERMGMAVITTGNQVMSGQKVNLDELGAVSQSFYDNESKTSWAGARSVEAEMGVPATGPDIPREARLSNAKDKPAFFDAIDKTPLLGTTCGVTDVVSSLPIISDVVSVSSSVIVAGLNTIASAFGTSVDSIMESALAAVSGKSVDTLAQGAAFGNLANTGAFLAGNDTAVAMGGVPESAAQVAEIKNEQAIADAQTTANESLAERYLDPYNNKSLVASLVDRMPTTSSGTVSTATTGMASLITGSFGRMASIFTAKAHAAVAQPYDYGVPTYGFSLEDQNNPAVANPYDNAAIIEQPGVLDALNAKYGKACFGMTVTATDTDLSVQTEEMGSDDLNIFKVQLKPECQPSNPDPMFLRYRFYLADAISAEGMACYEADDSQSCSDLGLGSSAAAGSDTASASTAPTASAGTSVDLSTVYDDSSSVACAANTKDVGIQDGYTNGKVVKIRACAVSNLPSTGEESNGGFGVTGANGKAVINSRASGAVYAMVEAAKKDGVTLTAISSFRTMSHQQALCAGNPLCASGNYTKVAKPGTSNHQMGLAIDFGGGLTSDPGPIPGNQFWDWLSKNAGTFGYKNYPSESWHWSPTGS